MTDALAAPRRLESWLRGGWVRGSGEPALLRHAATGAPVAEIDATGVDLGSALAYGREVGGPALRAMTFHQRALMLKALGQHLMARKEAFYEVSKATGATRSDAWIDIEGGIGTMLVFGSKGRRELPNARIWVEPNYEPLARDGSFGGQHVLTPLEGVAVHINAFNFPVWGMLEKIAPTLLAGMPALVKPASQTAYLSEFVTREIVASGILPEGALQLLCGSAGDLFDHLGAQDVVTLTGSAATGHKLRAHPTVVANSIRFTMEADSLNASVLGPDAAPGTPEFDLFIREARREMTAKAGQKCTAIRRLLVPETHLDAVIGTLSTQLAGTPVGDPEAEGVKMGALASLGQREDVRAQIAKLRAEAEIVSGDPDHPRITAGDPEAGAFLNPVLLHCPRPREAEAAHSVEAFGPVATVMPYRDLDDAIDLARRGGGSLVASVFTHDREAARDLALGLAPWHGRVLIGDRTTAKTSTGHGSPLAHLVHGGPGRAGGGEELGGVRSVKHFMQRTALQGSPDMLTAATGRWTPGASARVDGHPFRKSLAELEIGDRFVSAPREVTQEDVEHFAAFTGDTFYAHMDEAAARANPFFDGRVAHGYLIVSFAAGLFVEPSPGPVLANYGVDNLRFLTPVYFGDTLQVTLTAKEITPRETEAYGEVRWDATIVNQNGALVAQYDVLTMVAKRWPAPPPAGA